MKNLTIIFILGMLTSCAEGDLKEIGGQIYQDSKLSVCNTTCRNSLAKGDYNGLAACQALCRRQNQKKK